MIPQHLTYIQSLISPSPMAQFDSEWEQLLKSSQPTNFSDATVFDILSRLPVKAILRFKTVCKQWHAVLGSSQFIEAHFNRSWSNQHYLVKQYPECPLGNQFASFSLMSEENLLTLIDLDFNQPYLELASVDIAGSADGIVCLVINDMFDYLSVILLWNPATRQLKRLSKINPKELPWTTPVGFGFDGNTNDYAVVIILCHPDSFEVNVYSLRADSWRVVEIDSSYKFRHLRQPAVYMNGRMHWFGRVGSHELIVSYDVAKEKFIGMNLPKFEYFNGYALELCESPASLGKYLILSICGLEKGCQTWFMKEYGDSRSWSKLYCFPSHPIYGSVKPCIFLDNGKIMMYNNGNMLVYDPKNQVYQVLNVDHDACVVKYKESLVSIGRGSKRVAAIGNPPTPFNEWDIADIPICWP